MLQAGEDGYVWQGYADAKPSESIQTHELPGLAVAVIFPHHPVSDLLGIPIKQYKDYGPRHKGKRAAELSAWLKEQKDSGLVLSGFVHSHTQLDAAAFGLDLLEELQDTRVEKHYDGYRLHFGSEHIDLSQAVALEYYVFTARLGILRAGAKLAGTTRKLSLAMDRFPGSSPGPNVPGGLQQATQGHKFVEFIRHYSDTAIHIEKENRSIGLSSEFVTLDWWRHKKETAWREGKSHPHFVLTDWLVAAAIANAFPNEFLATFVKPRDGDDAHKALVELFQTFKSFDLWSMDSSALAHVRAGKKVWTVNEEARNFVLARASR